MGIQVQCSIYTKVQETDYVQTDQSGRRTDSGNTIPKKGDRNNRGRSVPGSHPYAHPDTTQIFGIRNNGIFKRKKIVNDLREAGNLKI